MQGKNTSFDINFQEILNNAELNINSDYLTALTTILKSNNHKIAVIESVTGGAIGRKLVEMPGASNYFLGGVMAYSPKLKIQYGLVSPKTMSKHGIVSSTVTEEMAKGIKKVTNADITIASNGIAGPQNDTYSIEQSGTIFLSWNFHDNIIRTKRFKIEGGRNEVIDKTVFIALSLCLKFLKIEMRKEI